MKAVLTFTLAVVALVMIGAFAAGTGKMVTANEAVPEPPALSASNVTLNVPATPGVPEINPVLLSTLRPVGRPAASKLVGPLEAVIW